MRINWKFYGLALALAGLLTLSGQLAGARRLPDLTWHADAPLWLFLKILLVTWLLNALHARWQRPGAAPTSVGYYFRLLLVSGAAWIAFWELAEFVFRLLPGARPHEWGWYPLLRSVLLSLTDVLLISGLYLPFLYQQDAARARTALERLEKEATQARLQALQQHVDPHFLFNNLNILAALIEPANQAAHEYVTHLANLYRYLVRTHQHDAVPVAEELAFLRDFQSLLRRRFGAAYVFEEEVQVPTAELQHLLIPPGVGQELLTNALKHNLGSRREPLRVRLTITARALIVRNTRQPRPTPAEGVGSGLAGIRARLALLTDAPVEVTETPHDFTISLPLLPALTLPAHAHSASGR